MRILRVQRQDKATGVTEFAVVIIFNYIALADTVNPFKQLQPACYGHDNTGREMVGWGKMYYVGTAFLQLVNHQAVVINGDVLPGIAEAGGDGGEFFIARFFDGEGAGMAEHLQQAAVKIFRTGADDNLRRINLHSTVVCQVGGNSLAQLVDTFVGNSFEQLFVVYGKRFAHQACPGRQRKVLQADAIGLEVGKVFTLRCLRLHCCGSLAAHAVAADVFYEVAFLFARGDVAFYRQLGVGVGHGDDAHAQMLCQRALGGQAFACLQPAADDILTDALV